MSQLECKKAVVVNGSETGAKSNKSMNGKICMVTGATSSIGEVTARELARLGATVIVVGRNAEKCAATTNMIKQQTKNQNVEFLLADLSSQREIRRLAQQFRSRYEHLHVLINNAGAVFTRRKESVDGIEMTFAVNYLGYFLLTNLLLDILQASVPSRIINVSADVEHHKVTKINFDDLQSKKKYRFWHVYMQTKLADWMFTYELAERLKGTQVTVNALHPGVLSSNLGMNNEGILPRIWRVIKPLVGVMMTSPEKGAQTVVYLATSPEMVNVTGEFFMKQEAMKSYRAFLSRDTTGRLWHVSAELTGL
jgi:NAD(P)-dependent dehydrogenase (short-subunit alcohol dehydrogenase family)